MTTSVPGLWDPPREGRSLLDVVGSGATGDARLPDDQPVAPGGVPWAPGALAGVMARHMPQAADGATHPEAVAAVSVLDLHTRDRLDRASLLALYDSLVEHGDRAPSVVTQAVSTWGLAVASDEPTKMPASVDAVRQLSGWLITTGLERGPVRTGISLAAMLSDLGGHARPIAVLGRHVELSAEACQALGRGGPGVEPLLFELAVSHHGWGRIHAVDQLSLSANPDVRRWLIQGGFRNDVMWEYTACDVAVRCDLAEHLAAVDDGFALSPTGDVVRADLALLDGARDLLATLLSVIGPAGDIEHYAEAGRAAESWLRLTARRPPAVLVAQDLDLALQLGRAARDDPRASDANGFSSQVQTAIGDLSARLLAEPSAVDVVESALAGSDGRSMFAATEVAGHLGLDVTQTYLARVRADADDTNSWWQLAQAATVQPEVVVRAALELLPEDCVGRSARATLGPGPGPHLAFTYLLQHLLTRHPGVGWPLVERCLRSPLVGPRSQALTTLMAWPRRHWPEGSARVLHEVWAAETDPALRTRLADALAGL